MTKSQKIVIIIFAVLLIGIIATLGAFRLRPASPSPTFSAPEFDKRAKTGLPDITGENYGMLDLQLSGIKCTVSIDPQPRVQDNELMLNFALKDSNTIWVSVIVYDEFNNKVGESGILRPGQYLESVTLNKVLQPGEKIKVTVVSYEPDTYLSKGSASIATYVQ